MCFHQLSDNNQRFYDYLGLYKKCSLHHAGNITYKHFSILTPVEILNKILLNISILTGH